MSCASTRAVTEFLRRKSEEFESLDVAFIELMCDKIMHDLRINQKNWAQVWFDGAIEFALLSDMLQ